MNKILISFLVFTLLFLNPLSSFAEYIEPGSVKINTVSYQPEESELKPGTYSYKINWQGFSVARGNVEVFPLEAGSVRRKVVASTRTSGIVSAFYKMSHLSESVFEDKSFKPFRFTSNQKERSKEKFREVDFLRTGEIHSKRWKKGKEKNIIKFQTEKNTFDPISAAFLAKSLPLSVGKKLDFDVFNGKHRYLISFNVTKKENLDIKGKSIPAFKVVPEVKKLTDSEGEKKLKSATLWISADSKKDILKLESKVWVGSVVAKFEKFVPKGSQEMIQVKAKDNKNLSRAQLGETLKDALEDSNIVKSLP